MFTKYLSQFKVISHFKPLLDAFQGSFKDKQSYWMGISVFFRASFFALYGLPIKVRLILATMLLTYFSIGTAYLHPYKNKLVNFQEVLLLVNLTIIHAVSYQEDSKMFILITNVMVSLTFFHFIVIVFYHILTYTCRSQVNAGLQAVVTILRKIRLFKKTKESFDVFEPESENIMQEHML